ncbi:MAG: class I SAM-dependent methyltransferase [Rhodobacteraceae bacterium]|nr:class I SAM-dependent methyltransferase [Paracoccaceae bacterium]
MTTMTDTRFWDRIAKKYAKSPIRNMPAYEATLARVAALLGANDNVLEIGCGTGTTALKLAPGVARYTACDISPKMIEIAQNKAKDEGADVSFAVAPVVETEFGAGEYDAVLGFNILHLVPDLPGAIARAHELLKPGGLYITKTPCLGQMGWHIRALVPVMQFFGKAPFVDIFTADRLEELIGAAGFEIVEARVFEDAADARFIVARRP